MIQHHRQRTGWSLSELVLTVLILGILAAVATVSYISSIQHARLQHAATRLAADLRLTRAQARADAQPHTFTLDTATCSYAAPTVRSLENPNHIAVNLQRPPFHLSSLTTSPSPFNITFDANGQPSAPGKIVLYCGQHNVSLTLETSGEISEQW